MAESWELPLGKLESRVDHLEREKDEMNKAITGTHEALVELNNTVSTSLTEIKTQAKEREKQQILSRQQAAEDAEKVDQRLNGTNQKVSELSNLISKGLGAISIIVIITSILGPWLINKLG